MPTHIGVGVGIGFTKAKNAPKYRVFDNFNRAFNTVLGNAVTGQAWVILGAGSFGTTTNQAYQISGTDVAAVIDANVANCEIGLKVIVPTTSTRLIFRATDVSNYLMFQGGSTGYTIYRRVAGVFTQIGSISTPTAAGDVLKVVLSGSSIVAHLNGKVVMSPTETFNQTATIHGFSVTNVAGRVDDFYVL